MSRRRQLEHEVSLAQERIKKAPKDTPKEILKTKKTTMNESLLFNHRKART